MKKKFYRILDQEEQVNRCYILLVFYIDFVLQAKAAVTGQVSCSLVNNNLSLVSLIPENMMSLGIGYPWDKVPLGIGYPWDKVSLGIGYPRR